MSAEMDVLSDLRDDVRSRWHIIQDDQRSASPLVAGIMRANAVHGLPYDWKRLCLFAENEDGELIGGLEAETFWNWLHIVFLWTDVRGEGIGTELVLTAEEEARRRGCTSAHLDTFDFQAPGFYEKLGYEEFGSLSDFPPPHRRRFLKKAL
jgi:GNAT superfamily N-acetyltransferase